MISNIDYLFPIHRITDSGKKRVEREREREIERAIEIHGFSFSRTGRSIPMWRFRNRHYKQIQCRQIVKHTRKMRRNEPDQKLHSGKMKRQTQTHICKKEKKKKKRKKKKDRTGGG